jgi:OmpA-OmpF porin, OOP family
MRHRGTLLVAVIAAAAFGATPSVAVAQAADAGFYLGAGFGQATADEFCEAAEGRPGWTINSCDDKASAWKIFAGYRLNRHVAIEGTYLQTDDFTAQLAFTGVPVSLSADARAYGIAALGIWPFTPQFSIFGKLGIAKTEVEGQGVVLGQTISADGDDTGLHYGLGLMFDIGRHFGLRAEWEKLAKGEFDMWSLGLYFRF